MLILIYIYILFFLSPFRNLNDTLNTLSKGELSDMGAKLATISSKYYVSNEKVNELQKILAVARNVRI